MLLGFSTCFQALEAVKNDGNYKNYNNGSEWYEFITKRRMFTSDWLFFFSRPLSLSPFIMLLLLFIKSIKCNNVKEKASRFPGLAKSHFSADDYHVRLEISGVLIKVVSKNKDLIPWFMTHISAMQVR